MLLLRSIPTLHICILLFLAAFTSCQYYNPDYRVNDDVHETDHGDYRNHDSSAESHVDDKPDYSKYYQNEGSSASLLAPGGPSAFIGDASQKESDSGFVSPLDFSGFYSSGQFGASSNQQQSHPAIPIQNPFHYQEALKKQNSTGFVDAAEFSANFANAPNFELEVGKHFTDPFEQKTDNTYVAPKKDEYNKPKLQSYKTNSEVDDLNSYEKPKLKNLNLKNDYKVNSYYPPINPIVPTLSSYTTGKVNHLAPLKTYVPLNIQPTLPALQKYNLPNIKSTLAPLNSYNLPSTSNYDILSPTEFAQPSEYKSQKVQNANCQKIAKHVSAEDISHGRFRRQADKMNCYLCKDPKSGGTYEQCSYTSDPENEGSYFRGHAEKYSTKTYSNPEEHTRKKRDTKERRNKKKRNDKEEVDDYVNPFNYQKKNSHNLRSKPSEFDDSESYYQAPDFSHYEKDSENYKFSPEYFTDASNSEKSYSELQSEELVKNGENCKKIKKESMTCMVCANPKTGGNYEQCSYTSEPNEKKYAYVKEKKYNSNDPEEKTVESTETKPTIQRNKSRYQKPKSIDYSASHPKEVKSESDYYIPHDFIAESKQKIRYEESELDKDKNKNGGYVYKLFPEYAEKESKNQEIKQRPGFEYKSDLPEYFTAEESKKDVDSVLQEFTKKDRSKCKKIAKDKMTCYICLDSKGVQHEECMFVSESAPKSSHIAYHEVKEFSSDPKKQNNNHNEETEESKQVSEVKPVPIKRKTKKNITKPQEIKEVDAEPTEYVKVVGKKPRIVRRRTNISKEFLGNQPQESKRQEVKVENPNAEEKEADVEFDTPEGPEGAYASELVPVFDEKLGVTLPKFMLEISEGEKVYDEVVKSG